MIFYHRGQWSFRTRKVRTNRGSWAPLLQLFTLKLRHLRLREGKWLPQHGMISRCQNPDGDLPLKSYYRQNFSKAGDFNTEWDLKKTFSIYDCPLLFFPQISWLLTMTGRPPIPTSKSNIRGAGTRELFAWMLTSFPRIHLISISFKKELHDSSHNQLSLIQLDKYLWASTMGQPPHEWREYKRNREKQIWLHIGSVPLALTLCCFQGFFVLVLPFL